MMAMLSSKQRAAKRNQILKRDGPNCWLCGTPVPEGDMTIDHAIPVSKGGSNCVDNLRLAHKRCNIQRGNLDAIRAAKLPAWQERAKKAGAALQLPAIVDGRRMAETGTGSGRSPSGAVAKPIAHDYRAFVGKHTGNWSSIDRDPTPPHGGQVWDSKRRAWVDARTGEVVGKVAA